MATRVEDDGFLASEEAAAVEEAAEAEAAEAEAEAAEAEAEAEAALGSDLRGQQSQNDARASDAAVEVG